MEPPEQIRFRKFVWSQFKKNKPALFSLCVLIFVAIAALLAPLIANDRPLYAKIHGEKFFPALSSAKTITVKTDAGIETINPDVVDWMQLKLDGIIWAPIV